MPSVCCCSSAVPNSIKFPAAVTCRAAPAARRPRACATHIRLLSPPYPAAVPLTLVFVWSADLPPVPAPPLLGSTKARGDHDELYQCWNGKALGIQSRSCFSCSFQSQMFFHFSNFVPNLLFESWDISTPARELPFATVMAG